MTKTKEQCAEYVAEISKELAELAKAQDFAVATHLLEMVILEMEHHLQKAPGNSVATERRRAHD
ncbi:hypothetical protein MXD81_49020 [Microbacteriaceae bacterium K1510]|nr:hypothetical protein [Microbacteriaceae bacterium K1510]